MANEMTWAEVMEHGILSDEAASYFENPDTDRVAQVNWIQELAVNISENLGEGTSKQLVDYALSKEGRESWGIEIPEWFDEADRNLLITFVGEAL